MNENCSTVNGPPQDRGGEHRRSGFGSRFSAKKVWGKCVKNVPKSAKMWKIDKNVKFICGAFTASYVI